MGEIAIQNAITLSRHKSSSVLKVLKNSLIKYMQLSQIFQVVFTLRVPTSLIFPGFCQA